MISRRSLSYLVCLLALAAVIPAVGAWAAGPATSSDADALRAFVLGDFGGVSRATLETNALPYKVVATALVMSEERSRGVTLSGRDIPAIYRRFGFLYPTTIANWPAGSAPPTFDRPIGMIGHTVSGPLPFVKIDAVTLGCATCHAGRVYGADGHATDAAWVGSPSTSVNLEAYTQAVYRGLQAAMTDQGAFRGRIASLFPETSGSERFTLRFFLMPRVAKRLKEFAASGDAPLPFSNGGAGLTNGVAALKHIVGVVPGRVRGPADVGFTSIPDLSSRGIRTSLLYDGVYAPLGADHFMRMDSSRVTTAHVDSLARIIAFFTVSTMGVSPDVGEKAIPAIRDVVDWLARRYTSPAFPAAIDSARMRAGETLFVSRCAQCHGTYGDGAPRRIVSFPNRLVPQAMIGSDSSRWAMIDDTLITRLNGTAYKRHIDSRHTGGYVAPILSGLWTTAPYLHNGSVPTLWQLLNPETRPERFYVGGHALDYTVMGIAGAIDAEGVYRYPSGYSPFSTPELYDTREAGRSNRGHERQFGGLTADEKHALLEYLKTL